MAWVQADGGGFPRSVSPLGSRGNSVGGDFLAPGIQARRTTRRTPRSLSPTPGSSVVVQPTAVDFRNVSSMASSLEAPCVAYAGADNQVHFADGMPTNTMAPIMATLSPEVTRVRMEQEPLKLQDAQVFFQGQRAPLSQMVQDTVTQQFLKIKDAMNQEVNRCIQTVGAKANMCEDLLQRLEAERASRQSTLLGLRHDFDRQQAQISELVQSRLSTSAVQDQALRDRDEELSIAMDNLRRDVELMRNQYRNSLAGNATTSDQQQRVEKVCLELRRDLQGIQADHHRYKSVHPKMEKAIVELRGQVTAIKDAERNTQEKGVQQNIDFSTLSNQLSMQREYQQQVERVVLELRKDRQSLSDESQGVVAGLQMLKDRADEQQKTFVEQQQLILDLRNGSQAQLAEARKKEQLLSASFGSEILAKVDKLEEELRSGETIQRLQRDSERSAQMIQDLERMINTETALRKDSGTLLEGYHASSQALQERVALVESVQHEDRGIRERTMEQMEVNLAELVNASAIETDIRTQATRESARQAEEVAELKKLLLAEITAREELQQALHMTSSDIRKDHEQMVLAEREARLGLFGEFDSHRVSSGQAFDRLSVLEREFQGCQRALEEGLLAEEAQRESQRAEYISNSTVMRAEVELILQKLGRLEALCEDNDSRQGQISENLEKRLSERVSDNDSRHAQVEESIEKRLSELHRLVRESVGVETATLRGGLEHVKSSLNTAISDLEVERGRRTREASELQSGLQVLQSQFAQLEAVCAAGDGKVENLRSHLLRDTEPALQSLKSQLCSTIEAVSRDVKTHKTEMAQETSQLQSGIKFMAERLAGLETQSCEDRGWRQQAVQDLEGILGEIKHITPTAASTRALPTLASALRLCKSEGDKG